MTLYSSDSRRQPYGAHAREGTLVILTRLPHPADYFEYEMGNVEAGNKGKMTPETQAGIRAWLEANK